VSAPFDLELLRAFVMVADLGGFTRAAKRLRLSQSTVSLQIKRLETRYARQLFDRQGRQVTVTPDGEVLLTYARRILELSDEANARLSEPAAEGVVRLGTPEDFATVHLPQVLARFARSHPRVALEVNCDLTLNLLDGFGKGQYDLVLIKREPQGPSGGVNVWREPLVWAGPKEGVIEHGERVPLVLSPQPCVYRRRATAALEARGRSWRVSYVSPSLAGVQAAVKAGLGVTVLPKEMVSHDLSILPIDAGFPPLPDTEIALYRSTSGISKAAGELADFIMHALESEARVVA